MTREKKAQLMVLATLSLFTITAFIAWRDDKAFLNTGPEIVVREEGDAVVFQWSYAVLAPMAQRFSDAFDAWSDRADRIVIVLNSPGGSVAEGGAVIAQIERMKRTHRVDTRVGRFGVCASMCVPIYLRGEKRTAAASARFMFHEPSTVDALTDEEVEIPAFEQRMDAERLFKRYFENSGMNAAFAAKLKVEMAQGDVWFTSRELLAEDANVIQEIE